ncbi:hypothetical protein SDC9_142984 [bioreactor metagenome]|uniref:Uncharacterized protein n=1 Tax=bioreactor metagenome TaxID=1076179 RepID=A0A645E2R9_9ZZZZ
MLSTDYIGIQAYKVTAVPSFPDLSILNEFSPSGKHSSGNTPQAFIKRDIDTVKQAADISSRFIVIRKYLKKAGTIQMKLYSSVLTELRNADQFLPRRQLAAYFTLGKFDQQACNWFIYGLQVLHVEKPIFGAE